MILPNRKFVRAVPEAWFSSTVEKDDVKIINMFYDISAVVSYGHWYDTIWYHILLWHGRIQKAGTVRLYFHFFYVPFTVSTF
jgi:hypothetical protein